MITKIEDVDFPQTTHAGTWSVRMIRHVIVAAGILAGHAPVAAENGPVAEGYRVMAYDGRTHQYTIHRNGTVDGRYLVKKIVVLCASHRSSRRGRVMGETACDLPVGKLFQVHVSDDGQHNSAHITEQNDLFSIVEGKGADQIVQRFNVLSVEVLPDCGCR
jgi:hypothetical protein